MALRKTIVAFCVIGMGLAGVISFSKTSFALEKLIKGAPAHVSPLPHPNTSRKTAGALTVFDVPVDETGDNAVVAREKAMMEAKRAAFKKLAERNGEKVPVPDDRTLGILVQDFEIQNEKLSATRYVAMFTVRFRDIVRNYMTIDMMRQYPSAFAQPDLTEFKTDAQKRAEEEAKKKIAENTDAEADITLNANADTEPSMTDVLLEGQQKEPVKQGFFDQKTLVLPYLEKPNKTTILWEADNVWRETWQREGHDTKAGNRILIVPLGDVTDVSMGSEQAVWSGDYRILDKLKMKYDADSVLLAIAKKNQDSLDVDLYFFREGNLQKRQTLQAYIGRRGDEFVYREGIEMVRRYLENMRVVHTNRTGMLPETSTVEEISKSLTGMTGGTSTPHTNANHMMPSQQMVTRPIMAPQPMPGQRNPSVEVFPPAMPSSVTPTSISPYDIQEPKSLTNINAQMSFSQYATWMDFQRRITTMKPLVEIQIQSLSRNGAKFKLQSNAHMDVVRAELQRKGVLMSLPPAPNATRGHSVSEIYDVRLMN